MGQIIGSSFRIHNLFNLMFMAEVNAKALSRSFSACRFNFIARGGNIIAHAMAAEGLKSTKDQFWVEDAPLGVIDLAVSDHRFIEPPR
ncbi:hypothetical protein Gotur_003757, partial [Gossypium turneri]